MKIIIADDHAIFRDSLKFLLSNKTDHAVVAMAENSAQLKLLAAEHLPDLVLIDYHMPEGGSLAAAEYLKQKHTNTKVLFLTGTQASFALKHITESKVDGVLHKEEPVEVILDAIDRVLKGEKIVSPCILDKLNDTDFNLTGREFHTLSLIVLGQTSAEIAEAMNISSRTVDKHKENIMQKMGVSNVVQLVALAHRLQLFSEENS